MITHFIYSAKEISLGFLTMTGLYSHAIPQSATDPCRSGSKNSIRTTWVPKGKVSSKEADALFRSCLAKYPQDGCDGIDIGGWEIVDDRIAEGGSARVEFRSGVGKIAKYANNGQPFVDDLLFRSEKDGRIEIRSSSRKGYDDMGVNKKRVERLATFMPQTFWDIPEPNYENL